MAVTLTNLSNQLYVDSRHRLNASATRSGITDIRSYDIDDLRSTSFFNENRGILDQPVGIGYWLWKPYIILETLKSVNEGDIVVYADSGLEIIAPLDPLYGICRNDSPVLLFGNSNFTNDAWTKRDNFILMDCDSPAYWYASQVDAAFSLFRRSEASLSFVSEWLNYCRDPRNLTDMDNTLGKRNLPAYIQHRWDQSVLSLMAAKRGVPLYRMPSQFGNHYKAPGLRLENEFNCVNQYYQVPVAYYAAIPYYNSPYPQLLDHHRSRSKQANSRPKKDGPVDFLLRVVRKRYNRWMNGYALRQEMRKRNPHS